MGRNERLHHARLRMRWSQEKAAEAATIARKTYIELETGKRTPQIGTLDLLCTAFHASPQEIGYNELGQPLAEHVTPPGSVVPDQSDGLIVLTREQAECIVHLLNLGDKDMNQSKRDAFTWLLGTKNGTALVPFSGASPQPALFTATHSRRQAIATLIGTTAAVLGLSQESGFPQFHPEEILLLCASNIPLCWSLYFEEGPAETKEHLTPYLSLLSMLASSPAAYQKQAAGLASQAYQLSALVEILFHNLGTALEQAKCSVAFAALTNDARLMTAAQIRLAVVYSNLSRPRQRLMAYEQALQYCEPTSPLLRARVYAGLTETYSVLQDEKAAFTFLERMHQTVPAQYDADPNFAYTHFDPWSIYMYEKDMWVNFGKPEEAWKTLEKSHRLVEPGFTVNRVDLTVKQAETAVLLGNLEAGRTYLVKAAEGAGTLGSQLLAEAVSTIYMDMRQRWPKEQSILELEEQFKAV